jgi:type III secretion protein Q
VRFPSLRRVAEADRQARAALAFWSRRDEIPADSLCYAPLPATPFLIAIDAYRHQLCWCGYIDLAEWLAHTIPDLARIAKTDDVFPMGGSPVSLAKMIRLFEASERPLEMPVLELAYDVLHIRNEIGASTDECLLSIVTPQGRVWLRSYPAPVVPESRYVALSYQRMPLSLVWCLGSSAVSRKLIHSARRGDILLIRRERFEIYCANTVIGQFSINEDGEITVEVARQHDLEAQDISWNSTDDSIAGVLADIPLRLDFILQRRMTTLAQLDALYRGQVLQFDPQSERQVEIAVNGMRIARGELVELNGCLGVELHEISVGQQLTDKQDA